MSLLASEDAAIPQCFSRSSSSQRLCSQALTAGSELSNVQTESQAEGIIYNVVHGNALRAGGTTAGGVRQFPQLQVADYSSRRP